MAKELGPPYTQIPISMFTGFGGGVGGWGTTCGALLPATALIGIVVEDKKLQGAMINELMAWYTQSPFPEYQPANLDLPQVKVGSTLCHISVTKWCNTAGCSSDSCNKKERCAGVCADVVSKTVKMLNEWTDCQTFTAAHKPDPIVDECMSCHKDNEPYTHTKENCMQCHGESLINVEECDPHDKFM